MLLSTFLNKGEFIIKNGVNEMNYIATKTFPIDFLEYIYSTASETISSPLNPSSGPFSVLAISDPFSSLDGSFKIIKVLHAQKQSCNENYAIELTLPFDQSIKMRLPHVWMMI